MKDSTKIFHDMTAKLKKISKTPCNKGIIESVKACCPCHNDKSPSLTLSLSSEGRILIHCHAGCNFEDIVHELGFEISDLFADGKEQKKSTWRDKQIWFFSSKCEWEDDNHNKHKGYGEGVHIAAEYHYRDDRNNYLYSKIRFEGGQIPGKLIRYYTINESLDTASTCKKSEVEHVLYRLPELLKHKTKANKVFIVEGEKDVETLRALKDSYFMCVTTAGSTSDWKKEFSHLFKGLNVVILRDNDSAGLKYAETIMKDLKRYAFSISIVNPSQLDHGDVTDYLKKENGTIENLKSMIENASVEYAPWVNVDKNKSINSGILANIISENESYKIVRNSLDDKESFLLYKNGVYIPQNKSEMKAMISEYVPACKLSDTMLNNTRAIIFSTYENITNINELNSDSNYINFANGLYNITTKQLESHSPDILSTFQYSFDYKPCKECPKVFEKYITDACTKPDGSIDQDQILIIQEYMGFILSNIPMSRVKKCLVLWSKLGDSGKSVLIRLIVSILGTERTASIKLLELVPTNRFILGNLPNCRLITCGDESNSNITDSSTFKALTGGDAAKIEAKGIQPISYEYRGGFMIACNGLPCFTDDKGGHLFDRLLIIPFEHHITADKKDALMDEKLKREIPDIVSWAIEGLHRFIDNGYNFTQSKSSKFAKEEYRKQMDNVYRYVTENYEITLNYNDKISKSDFDNQYHGWAVLDQSIKEVERKNLPARMEALGITSDKSSIDNRHGIFVYRGLRILSHEKEPAN